MLKKALCFFLTAFTLALSLSSAEPLSRIELPEDLDQNFPFEILEASNPKLTLKWVETSKSILLPFPEGRHISIQQREKLWNLITLPVENQAKSEVFGLWFHIGNISDDSRWNELPTKRKLLLALLCLPFAVLCYQARHKNHILLLGFLVLAVFFSPAYQHRVILHSDQSWEIFPQRLANWLKWENRPLVGLQVSQSARPHLEMQSSEFGLWLAPQLKQLGQIDNLWHTEHHILIR